ncbi:MAG: hypothetical protein N2C12_17605 [Planctomycetales bacterium]
MKKMRRLIFFLIGAVVVASSGIDLASASDTCAIKDAVYRPIGLDPGKGWRLEFTKHDFNEVQNLESTQNVAIVSGSFDGSPVTLNVGFFKIGGWPNHIDHAPTNFFNADLTPYFLWSYTDEAPNYMTVQGLGSVVAYKSSRSLTVGLGSPIWRLEGCRERPARAQAEDKR